MTIYKIEHDAKQTKDITVMDFDDKLEPINTFHPEISDDEFITMICSNSGSLFIAWYKDGDVNVSKYAQGKTEVTAQINQSLEIHNGFSKNNAAQLFLFYPSVKNPDCLYYSLFYKNTDNDPELTVSKMDFTKKNSEAVTEVFTQSHIKEIHEAYIPFDKKFEKTHSINGNSLEVRAMREENDRLLIFMSSQNAEFQTNTAQYYEGSLIINGYDLNLNTKYQQIFPSGYGSRTGYFYPGFHKVENSLYIVANLNNDGTLYGNMNITTGEWNNTVLLPKEKFSGDSFAHPNITLWYEKGFIIPYARVRGMMRTNMDISLQQIAY